MNKEFFGKRNWTILILFGLIGQIAWSVENMYFNLFVFETIAPSLDTVTLMVQLSGVVATVATLIAGTFSDKAGNRSRFISIGYVIWGISVALFGFLSPSLIQKIFSTDIGTAVSIALVSVVVADCVMTLFGSTANDACFNAWVTDNTKPSFRGSVEGVISILPLIAMLIVAGGFGILVSVMGYSTLFLCLGILISLCGIVGLKTIKDADELTKNGVSVLHDAVAEVHVSGHACQEEIKLMQALLRPKFYMPVHGEYRHLAANRELARDMGIDDSKIFISDIGKVL